MEMLPAELVKSLQSLGLEGRISRPEQAVSLVRSGDRVFLGTASATPRVLAEALEERADLDDVHLFHFLTDGAIPVRNGLPKTRFYHRVFFVGSDTRAAIKQGMADYVPICLAQVPSLIENKRIPIDVAMIQVSMPEEHGYISLGVSVDITRSVVQNARTVIAEVNPNMPITYGDTFIPLERLDRIVPVNRPVIEYVHSPADAVAERIARYVARIVEDGATLQVGLGRIPNEMLKYLTERRDLGIHSDVITDSIVDLIEKGVVTGRAKSMHRSRVVASYCMGTERLYRLIHRNPAFEFYPIDYVCNQSVIAKNRNFVSVTQAFAIDLTGQICADQYKGEFYSGVSTQPDFMRGAAQAPGGKPIICLPSTTEDERQSRIRPLLLEGEGVTIPRSDVHYVVTEYGSVYLFGKSIRDRALALIQISHPKFRSELLEEAKTAPEVKDKIIGLSLEHPAWGPMRISDQLRLHGVNVSPSTVRNIWIKEEMETRYKRLLRLEEEKNGQDVEQTEEQIKLLEKANPCFRERKVESPYPGYLLSQDTFLVGSLKGIGRIYLQAVVDTFGSFAFGKLYTSKIPESAVDILYDRVLPFYEEQGLAVEHILTDNGREYCGRPMIHPYQIFLEFNEIKHRRTKVAKPRTNGFVERFNRTVLDEFFRETFRNKFYGSVQELQKDLDQWLHYYNYERPHRGYRNMGRKPIETIEQGKLVKEQTMKKAA